jgi:hypothetical protein
MIVIVIVIVIMIEEEMMTGENVPERMTTNKVYPNLMLLR